MTLIKKFSTPLTAVALVAVMAIGLLGQTKKAEAVVSAVAYAAPLQAAGLTESWTVTYTTGTAVAGSGTTTFEFPTNFNTLNATVASFTVFAATPCSTINTSTNGIIICTSTAGYAAAGPGTVVFAGIVNPTATTALTASATQSATAGYTVTTSAEPEVAAAAAPQVFNTAATKNPTTSVTADGASTVAVTFTSSNGATLSNTGSGGALVYTVTTDVGTFASTPTTTGTGWGAPTAVTVPVTSVTSNSVAAMTAAATLVATVKAPSTAGTSTVILRATPAGGGQAVIVGSTSIVWTTATTQGVPASATVASAGNATTITSTGTGSTLVLTATFVDASGNAPLPGGTVNITTNLGTLTAPTNGATAGQSITGASLPVGGVFAVTLNGSGVGGPATVTFSVGAVSANKVISVTGTAATLELSGRRTNSATSFSAKGVVRNTDSTTAAEGQDELFVAGVAKDSLGNVLSGGTVTFTLTGPAGHTVTWAAAAEQLTLTGATCGGGSNVCIDAIQGGAFGDTTPAHAVAVIDVDSEQPVGTYTVTATIPGDAGATITGTMTFKLVKAPASLTIGTIATVGLGSTVSVPITCKDADGNACPSGTFVTINVSNANLIAQNPVTGTTGTSIAADIRTNDAGTANVNLIGVTSGTTNIVANVGTVTAVAAATVGTGPTPPPAGPSGFSGATISPTGITIVSYTGSTEKLGTDSATAKVVSVSATVGGKLITFVVGAPAFVNAEFNAAFPTGLTAALVIVKTA